MIEWIKENFRTLLLIGLGYWVAVEIGVLEPIEAPEWWPLAALAIGAVLVVGWIVGGKIADLLPDPVGTFVVAMEAHDAQGGAIYELNEEAWEGLRVVEGELFAWQASPHDVYECREFRPDDLTAVANWKGTKTASELSKPVEREEVMHQIQTLRTQHEQEARYGEAIRAALPALLRQLDKWRAKDLNAALEGHITPSLGERSIDDMIGERLPDEVLPNYLQEESPEDDDGPGDALELLDEEEPLEPLEPVEPLRNDGGTDARE